MKTLSLDRRPAKFRVESYTLAGVPCIIAGLNRHAGDFTMPSHWNVRALLDPCHTWIRQATEEEKAQHGKWYHVLNFKPAAVIHSNGAVAIPDDTIGLLGDRITVLAQVPVATFEEVPCADVDDVPTPPTPPPFYPESQKVRDIKTAVLRNPNGPRSRSGRTQNARGTANDISIVNRAT